MMNTKCKLFQKIENLKGYEMLSNVQEKVLLQV